jgi:predicted amidohydrolase
MNNTIKLALIQTDLVWENTQDNLDNFDTLLRDVKDDTDIIILPEVFSTGFALDPSNFEKPVGEQAFKWLKKKANSLDKVMVGSVIFEENEKYFNRMFWMCPDGSFEFYDKRHLFQMGDEHKVMTAGNQPTIVTYKNTKFNLQICYDLRFPVWVKNNYDKQTNSHDYDVLLYIANWPNSRKQTYMSLLKARAIENQAFVVWVNRVGIDGHKISFSGDSLLVNPLGVVQSQLPENQEEILYVEINTDELSTLRKNYKVGLDWDKFEII